MADNKLILSNAWASALKNLILGKSKTMTGTTQVWIGLSSNDPVTDGSFTEIPAGVTTTNYEREILSIAEQAYPDKLEVVSDRLSRNKEKIAFNKCVSGYTVKGVGFFKSKDRITDPNPFAWGRLTTADGTVQAVAGSMVVFEPEDFAIEIPDGTEAS